MKGANAKTVAQLYFEVWMAITGHKVKETRRVRLFRETAISELADKSTIWGAIVLKIAGEERCDVSFLRHENSLNKGSKDKDIGRRDFQETAGR
jgi:hypothetical protein